MIGRMMDLLIEAALQEDGTIDRVTGMNVDSEAFRDGVEKI